MSFWTLLLLSSAAISLTGWIVTEWRRGKLDDENKTLKQQLVLEFDVMKRERDRYQAILLGQAHGMVDLHRRRP
jgi:hypothetical protein